MIGLRKSSPKLRRIENSFHRRHAKIGSNRNSSRFVSLFYLIQQFISIFVFNINGIKCIFNFQFIIVNNFSFISLNLSFVHFPFTRFTFACFKFVRVYIYSMFFYLLVILPLRFVSKVQILPCKKSKRITSLKNLNTAREKFESQAKVKSFLIEAFIK